jgi:orotate phosphoribosyltransferase
MSEPQARSDDASLHDRLLAIVKERSFSNDREVTLASGKKSWLYFNIKPTMLNAEGAYLIGQLALDELSGYDIDYVGGLELGAVPIVSFVSALSFERTPKNPISAFIVRKKAKEHGMQQRIEGLANGETLHGKQVAMIEDVTTTGGSVRDAIQTARAAGAHVVKVVTVVDRQEGARDSLAQDGLELASLLTADEFAA